VTNANLARCGWWPLHIAPGEYEYRPAAQPGLAAVEARDSQLGTCTHSGAPRFLVVSLFSEGLRR
jgi:hypothetical protein